MAAPFAPLKQDGRLNTGLIPEYFRFLRHNGVEGVFINGTTGEGTSLTLSEKKDIVRAWTDAGKSDSRFRIINLVGGTSVVECAELAGFSATMGVSAIALMAPYYIKPSTVSLLGGFIGAVAAGVPETPVYFYHIPSLTGVNFPMIGLLEYALAGIPNFAGIKYTHDDLMDFHKCLVFDGGRYDIFWGRDETLLSALVLGARGAVGSTYNYAAPLYREIISLFTEGKIEQARRLQLKSVDMVSVLARYGGIGAGKAFMKYAGIDCGKFRLPVASMSDQDFAGFREEVSSLEMAEFLSQKPAI